MEDMKIQSETNAILLIECLKTLSEILHFSMMILPSKFNNETLPLH